MKRGALGCMEVCRPFTGSAPGVHEACMRGARRANAARAALRDGTEGVGERRTRMQKGAPRSSTAPKRLQERHRKEIKCEARIN